MSDLSSASSGETAGAPTLSSLRVALVLLALAVGSFAIGTGEFAIMGLLPAVADTFSVSTPVAGNAISAYALGVVIGAPLIAMASAKMSRRAVLLLLMTMFSLSNIASAIAPGFISFTLLRFLAGLPHGAYFGVGALVAASLVPVQYRARAVGRIMLGLTIATLAGTPLMAYFGQSLRWEVMFWAVGLIAAVSVASLWATLPKDRGDRSASVLGELAAFKRLQVWLTLAISAAGFGGLFAILSYIAFTATDVSGMSGSMVALVLLIFGVGANAGNIIGSKLADKYLMETIGGVLFLSIFVMAMFSATATNPYMLCLSIFLVGCIFAGGPAVQTRLMDVATEGQTLAAASMQSAFNTANAIGAWVGGWAIALGYGYGSTGYVGAALSAVGLGIFLISWWLEKKNPAGRAKIELAAAE